nr:hypothetical protein [Tanacetum cinerariifolium]
MDDPNITMEEYIMLEEEKACRRGKMYNWKIATYGKILYDEDVHDLRSFETKFPAIVYNDVFTYEVTLSREPTISPLNDKIDFRISFSESNDEDYMVKDKQEKDKIGTKPDKKGSVEKPDNHEEEHAANARYSKIPACCDDDDDYFAITPSEPVESLSMGDEHLNTIPATKSDEFIKSSVENLVPNPKKFFSNPLFNEEIISMRIDPYQFNAESDLIESLLNHDSSIIPSSSKIDSLLDEFAGELTLLKSISPGIDETDCDPEEDIRLIERLLYDNSSPRLPKEFVSENSNADIESFSPSPIPVKDSESLMEEINLSFTPDDPMPPGIKEDDDDSKGDIIILEELLDNYSLSLPKNESFHFDIPSFFRPPAKPPDGNTGILNIKMMGDNSEQKVSIPGLTITRVSNQEKSSDLLSHQGLETFQPFAKCPRMIHEKNIPILDVPLFHFYPP